MLEKCPVLFSRRLKAATLENNTGKDSLSSDILGCILYNVSIIVDFLV